MLGIGDGGRQTVTVAARTHSFPDRLPRWTTPVLLLAGAAVWLLRGWSRIAHPTLWAEDATEFVAGAYQHPVHALIEPYAGYLHAVPRLIALVASPLPLTWLPTVYALAAAAGAVAVAGLTLSARLRWLLPHRWQPPLAFALLILLPGMDEPYANIANLIFFTGLALVLLGLCDDPATRAGRVTELAALVPLVLTGPFAILALPVFCARWWRLRGVHPVRAIAIVTAGAAVQLVILLVNDRRTGTFRLADIPRFIGHNILETWLRGDRPGARPTWLAVAAVVWLVAFLVVAWRLKLMGAALIATVLIGVVAILHAHGYVAVTPYRAQRHLLAPLAIIVVVSVAGLADRLAWRRAVAALCLVAGLGGIVADFAIRPQPYRPIGPLADCLAAGHHPKCRAPVNPRGWFLILSPKR